MQVQRKVPSVLVLLEKLTFVVSLQLRQRVDGHFAERAVQQFLGFVLLRLSVSRSSLGRSWCSSWLRVRRRTTRRGAACRLGKRSGRAWHEGTSRGARRIHGRGCRNRRRALRYHRLAQLSHGLCLFYSTTTGSIQHTITHSVCSLFSPFLTIKNTGLECKCFKSAPQEWGFFSLSLTKPLAKVRWSGEFIAK